MAQGTQHTPGPWTVETWNYAMATPPRKELTITAEKDAVAKVNGLWRSERTVSEIDERQEEKANARLIAAAPELLAALKSITEAYQKMFETMPVAWQTYDDIAQSAIAKATQAD